MQEKHITEEKMVDYVLGNLSRVEYFRLNTHLKQCQACQWQVLSWQKVLNQEIDPKIKLPTKAPIYQRYVKRRQLKRRYVMMSVTGLSLFILIFSLILFNQAGDLSANQGTDYRTVQMDWHAIQVSDGEVFQSIIKGEDKLIPGQQLSHHRPGASLWKEIAFQPKTMEQGRETMAGKEKICFIYRSMEQMICYQYIEHGQGQFILFNERIFSIPEH